MPPTTPRQQINRERIEGLIALAAPFLDLVLAVGDRVARVAAPQSDYYPIRSPGETFEIPSSPRTSHATQETSEVD